MNTPTPSANSLVEILIAEDSPTQAERLRHILQKGGYRVTHAANGRLALEAAQRQKPTIIISDVVMPEMDGYELCRRVKADASLRDIPLILVTTMSDPGDVMRGLECCADNFILKPYDEGYLLGRVQFVLLNRQVLQTERATVGVEIFFNGQRHFITADRLQILNLLLSTYDAAIERTKEMIRAQEELLGINRLLGEANLRLKQEIGEREKAEQDLRESEVRLRSIVDNMAAFVGEMSPDGVLTEINHTALSITGLRREDVIGKRLDETSWFSHSPAVQAQTREDIERAQRGETVRHDVSACLADGTLLPIDFMLTPVHDAKGRVVKLIPSAVDITERKRSEAGMRESENRLQDLNKNLDNANAQLAQGSKLKDEFLANMSHELRTPLNAILGLSEALLEQVSGTLTPRQVKSISTISNSGAHLLSLINDILDLSKVEAGKMELNLDTVNVQEFCESCLVFVRTQAMRKHIGLAFEHDGRVATFSADPKRLKQILVNLLTNAVKFTPDGGRIGLALAAPEGGDILRFTVWDTGLGIAAEDAARLFKAFTQIDSGLSRGQEGTGLGLAMVAKLVELHGGSVTLESEPGKGSRFTVSLPMKTPANLGGEGRGLAEAPKKLRRALVVEDDTLIGKLLIGGLEERGFRTSLVVNGDDVMETAVQERPHVILMDITLPGQSGWLVLQLLKSHPETHDIPVVVVSGTNDPEKSRELGAAGHFTKPFKIDEVMKFVQHVNGSPADKCGSLILLAEDNEANIQTVGGYLEDYGFAMCYAKNGVEAVKLALDLRPALILMDIQMPVMDGLTAIREIRADAQFKDTPIIALTALAMPGDRERCRAMGATEYMSKPVSLKTLTESVSRLLQAGKVTPHSR